MSGKHKRILDSIFIVPTTGSLKFSDIEKLLIYLGAVMRESAGSRVSFELNDLKIFLHRPHSGKEARKYQIEAVREFLVLTGVRDE